MRIFIGRYTMQLLRRNSIYILSGVIFLLLILFVLPLQIKTYIDIRNDNAGLVREIVNLERKKATILSFNAEEVDLLVSTLDTLLPSKEDYFTIFTVLDNISTQTEFRVVSFTLILSKTPGEVLTLKITTEGTPEAFVKFLENYQYKGGRLITMDELTYSPVSAQTSLTLVFHTKDVKPVISQEAPKIDPVRLERIRTVARELQESLTTSPEEFVDTTSDYSTKDNPFVAF